MINYFTDNLLHAYYPPGAGGKFLLNCVGLSDRAVLQDRSLVKEQLKNNFSQEQKFNWLLKKLEHSKKTKRWNDLGLTCDLLFGDFVRYSTEIATLSNSQLIFTKATHDFDIFCRWNKTWPNAKILRLDNYYNFISTYRPHYLLNYNHPDSLLITWNAIRSSAWPVQPPTTLEEYNQLGPDICQEDQQMHNNAIMQQVVLHEQRTFLQNMNCIAWDCDWFFDCDICVNQVEVLYQILHLPDFDREKIKTYFLSWIDCLDTIVKSDVYSSLSISTRNDL